MGGRRTLTLNWVALWKTVLTAPVSSPGARTSAVSSSFEMLAASRADVRAWLAASIDEGGMTFSSLLSEAGAEVEVEDSAAAAAGCSVGCSVETGSAEVAIVKRGRF
jgi:hypothetical protein